MIVLKSGSVNIQNLHTAFNPVWTNLNELFGSKGVDCIVTSGNDSKHMVGSAHYKDRAIDLRIKHLRSRADAVWISERLIELHGKTNGFKFDIVLEELCIHIEFDPS